MLETLRSGQLSLGPMVDRFEAALAERVEAPYVAAVSSGTAGLHLSMRLAGIGPGDAVVTTPFGVIFSGARSGGTFGASATSCQAAAGL